MAGSNTTSPRITNANSHFLFRLRKLIGFIRPYIIIVLRVHSTAGGCPARSLRGTRWWVGRDSATLPEPTPSHTNCLKTRRLPPPRPRRTLPRLLVAGVAGVRVHLRRMRTSSFRKETGAQSEYTANGQTDKPYKAMEICVDHNPVVHLGFRSG